ncbi:MAG: CDP-diacylglycerol--glycerol-3-phosphate 3-phosphatidyltransferase [Treponema sp.]|nr:CDP-diacylglycerol--glycerol-3-phosphate 3-phosphatidyltransferase [Treponema sp.]
MTLADKVTSVRLVIAPVFFIIYLLPQFFPAIFAVSTSTVEGTLIITGAPWTVVVLWFLFILSEVTDLLDGLIARKRGEISDFGKLYDPFADTLTQLTYFFCFVIDGILPPLLFLAVLYREFSILFIRNLMLKRGIALGARMGGKIKTVTYILAGALALLASSVVRLGIGVEFYRVLTIAAVVVFLISVVLAIVSFFDYVSVYRKTTSK